MGVGDFPISGMYGDIMHEAYSELAELGISEESLLDLTPLDEHEEKKFLPVKWMGNFIAKELTKRFKALKESIALNGELVKPPVFPNHVPWKKAKAGDLFIIDDPIVLKTTIP